jgi:hypothetical protein
MVEALGVYWALRVTLIGILVVQTTGVRRTTAQLMNGHKFDKNYVFSRVSLV